MTKRVVLGVVEKLEKEYKNCVKNIKNSNNTRIRKKLLIASADRYYKMALMIEMNRKIDLKGMIEEDLRSRQLRDYNPCRCKFLCFCIDPATNKWLR